MKGFFRKLLGLVSIGAIWFAPPANACIDLGTFRIEGIGAADAIFVGEPLAYERVSPATNGTPTLAHLKVRVRQVLHGNMPAEAHLFWGSNFGIREHLDLPKRAIFAVDRASSETLQSVRPTLSVDDAPQGSVFRLNGVPCSSEFILDYTAENVVNIRKIVDGEHVAPHDYRSGISAFAERAARRRFEQERAFRVWRNRALVGLGIAVALISGLLLRRRRSKQT